VYFLSIFLFMHEICASQALFTTGAVLGLGTASRVSSDFDHGVCASTTASLADELDAFATFLATRKLCIADAASPASATLAHHEKAFIGIVIFISVDTFIVLAFVV